jgi:very-short-patch-repair endonuclease
MIYSRRINEGKQNLGASFNIKAKARDLRKRMTEVKKILWTHLRKKQMSGFYFRRQHPYGIYILDFYCFEANLALEVDGRIHLDQKEYDDERTRFLESSGLKVLRFNNEDIEICPDWVLGEIRNHLITRSLNRGIPFPIFTRERRRWKNSISPLGETGKGVKSE